MKSGSWLSILLLISGFAQGQNIPEHSWSEGTIRLSTNQVLAGSIFFDTRNQTVLFRSEDEMRSLKASKVLEFEFFDKELSKNRIFLSLPFEMPNKPAVKMKFLEVIKDFKNHMILSHISGRKVVLPAHKNAPAQTITQTVEEWYLLDESGVTHRYMSFVNRPVFGPKLEFYNSMLFKKMTTPYFAEVKEFSVQQKLNAEKPKDNLLLLEYSDQLSQSHSETQVPVLSN